MKTVFKAAEDVAGGDKIIVDGTVKTVNDADYVVPEWTSTIRIELVGGGDFTCGSSQSIEVVEE